MRILILAGGTGGHIYPALATAEVLRAQGHELLWMGTHKGLEARIVPAANIPMAWVSISGLRGKGALSLLLAPFKLLWASMQSLAIVLRYRPHAVLGMGGFVTGPGGLIARLLLRPLVLHEQNAVAGLTNRLLSPLANKVLTGFPNVLPGKQQRHVGNPVRDDIVALDAPEARFDARDGALRVLVLGGSLGALALNRAVPEAIAHLPEEQRPVVRHQAGQRTLSEAQQAYANAGVEADVTAYIEDMAEAYAWADLVVCRAGALTIAELAAAGVGSVLVPFPHAVDDHQSVNARYLSDHHAAHLLPQSDVEQGALKPVLAELLQHRAGLREMAVAARALAKPDATATVAQTCVEVAHG